MNVFAFIAAVIAAVLFLFGGEGGSQGRFRWSGISLGLFFLTLALVLEFCATKHTVTF